MPTNRIKIGLVVDPVYIYAKFVEEVRVRDQIAEGEMVVTRVMAKGTHTGPYLGLTPTNKPILIEGVNIDRIRNGKIIEHWGAANTLEALVSIGAFRLAFAVDTVLPVKC
jgi:hypothetical protein